MSWALLCVEPMPGSRHTCRWALNIHILLFATVRSISFSVHSRSPAKFKSLLVFGVTLAVLTFWKQLLFLYTYESDLLLTGIEQLRNLIAVMATNMNRHESRSLVT